jgi:hypothetical protein
MTSHLIVRHVAAAIASAILLTGCSSGRSSQSSGPVNLGARQSPEGSASKWKLSGSRIVACCCNTPCPCRMNYKPTHCHGCDATTPVHIEKGDIDGVDMSGIDYVIIGRFFAEDEKTNWNYVYVSDKASDAQMQALGKMLEDGAKAVGEKGQYLVGQTVGMRKVPIQWTKSSDGRQWTVKIPNILDLQTKSIVLPGRKEPVKSTGIFDDYGDKFIHADCIKHQYNDPSINYSWKLDGKQANQADFTLTSDQVAKGGLTWACWSAHADLGDADKTQYQEKAIGHE